jgi:hypothetical protein
LNCCAQTFIVDRACEASRKPHRRLIERHDLKALSTGASRREPLLSHGEAALNDNGGAYCGGHAISSRIRTRRG